MASKGKGARNKGAAFERLIVRWFRESFSEQPWASSVRRGKQSHTADESDVTGVPGLWIECQHADHVTPLKKLEQAERDAAIADGCPLRLAITRQTGSTKIYTHIRLNELHFLRTGEEYWPGRVTPDPMVSLSLADFLDLYRAHRCEPATRGPSGP